MPEPALGPSTAMPGTFHRFVVRNVYATHNSARPVRRALRQVLGSIMPGEWGLNLGAGGMRLGDRVINLDIARGGAVDVLADAHALPFSEGSVACVITQELLEHVASPPNVAAEIARVLKPGGLLYLQVPFVIGYHPGPSDFWRFSEEGIRMIAGQAGLEVTESGIAAGGGTGMYRIAVEFCAALVGITRVSALYLLTKGLSAVLLYPLKWLDPLLDTSLARDRIPGGFYVIARKPL